MNNSCNSSTDLEYTVLETQSLINNYTNNQAIDNSDNLLNLSDDSEDSESIRTPSQSHTIRYSTNRKKRRGVIEKKRRDRINNCLSELRRLVPQAFEKQGSQKLEKAEILQMTVEHLKFLQNRGLDTLMYDPERYAMDYHSMGFRECASEVAKYLSMVEGMDIQDPLRLRLVSHLQCFASHNKQIASGLNTPPCASMYPSTVPCNTVSNNVWNTRNAILPPYSQTSTATGYNGSAFSLGSMPTSSSLYTPPHNGNFVIVSHNDVTPTKADWSKPHNNVTPTKFNWSNTTPS